MEPVHVTLPGIILLGRIFTFRDIAAYWIAIIIAAIIERGALPQRQNASSLGV